ncbi:hypothetical protein [Aeromonas media]|uniref:hypothetical protein n=1 Tax=Aeromonas media TaxID=651 RepID=UPI00227DE872|nr:hypothetical protein [Aeromonas media]MCY9821880.1 hypothetical protein [Aeromonas media]
MEHHIFISKQATAQLILNGFEAFVVQHNGQRRSGIEIHASVYGTVKQGKSKTKYQVEFISVDTTADMKAGSVAFKGETQYLKEHLAKQIGFERIGGVHTHPYLAHEGDMNFIRKEGCDFSPRDLSYVVEELGSQKNLRVVEFLLTIKQNQRENTKRDGTLDDQKNVFEFSVGNCKCFIRAQVFSLNENYDLNYEETILEEAFFKNFEHLFADFGRVKPKDGRKHILEYNY